MGAEGKQGTGSSPEYANLLLDTELITSLDEYFDDQLAQGKGDYSHEFGAEGVEMEGVSVGATTRVYRPGLDAAEQRWSMEGHGQIKFACDVSESMEDDNVPGYIILFEDGSMAFSINDLMFFLSEGEENRTMINLVFHEKLPSRQEF